MNDDRITALEARVAHLEASELVNEELEGAVWRSELWELLLTWGRSRLIIGTVCALLLMGAGAALGWDAGDVAEVLGGASNAAP